ncbi:MAG: endonuclease III [Bilifractor sp.]
MKTDMSANKTKQEELDRKKKLALEVIRRLKKEYPDAACTLAYEDAWQLLVSVRLAAQCTDKRVDMITPRLYAKYPSVAALAAADPDDIEEIVKPCGLGHSKARDISKCMRMLHEQYNDHVPTSFDELLKLPGVGRKSANLVMGDVFGKPAIVTDTHCIRLCNRIGLVDNIKEPAKVERALWKIVPPEEGSDLCHRFVFHGRKVCTARKPECNGCCLEDVCRYGCALKDPES